jgi:hypothetical protein
MSRLLVIEPNLMLRYAVAVALTPDHGIQFFDRLPESSALADVDAVIVDAATLRLGENPPLLDLKAIERWQVPTVWIGDKELPAPPARAKWVNLKPPVQREQLLKAVFECLNPATGSISAARKVESSAVMPAKARAKKTKAPDIPASDSANLIELGEVVDDEPENG